MTILDKFRSIYTYLNDETLVQCAKENPDFLVELIISGEISEYSKSCAIDSLASLNDEKYLKLFMEFSLDESCEISLSAYDGLDGYFYNDPKKYYFIYNYFNHMLEKEKRARVLEFIRSSISQMDLDHGVMNVFMRELSINEIHDYKFETVDQEKSLEWINEYGSELIVSFKDNKIIYSAVINDKSYCESVELNEESFEKILKLIKEIMNEKRN